MRSALPFLLLAGWLGAAVVGSEVTAEVPNEVPVESACAPDVLERLEAFLAAEEALRGEASLEERLAGHLKMIPAFASTADGLLLRTSCRRVLAEVEDALDPRWSEALAACPPEIVAGQTPLDGPLEVPPLPELPEGVELPLPIVLVAPVWPRRAARSRS